MLPPINDFTPTKQPLIQRFEHVARWCGGSVAAFGLLMTVLWLWQPVMLLDYDSLWLTKVNTALILGVCGAALVFHGQAGSCGTWTLSGWRRYLLSTLLIGAGLLAALTLLEYVTGLSFGIDTLVIRDPYEVPFPGRTAPPTALALLLVVTGLLTSRSSSGPASYLCDATIVGTVVLLHAVISGYVHHDGWLTGLGSGTPVSPQAIAALIVLVVGLVCARADTGLARILSGEGRGSIVIRWLLPPVALLPIVLGVVRIWGESAGLEAFAALFAAVQSVMRIALIVGMGYLLNRSEAQRRAEQARREEAERMVAMCAWTQRVRWNGDWIPVDEFLRQRFGLEITHGISDDALAEELDVVEATRRTTKAA
jgi:hypothetical protein